ncbi:MAG: DUF169 domain-containing protein [Alphaproteobacteria bacterium]
MPPDPSNLLRKAGIELPLIGVYDAPDAEPFAPLIRPPDGKWACVFMFYKRWLAGETLHITRDNYGCGGAGRSLFGVETRSREEFIKFLAEEEGLSSPERMALWLDSRRPRPPEHKNVLIGPLKDEQYPYLKTVSFLLNPDQLALFVYGTHYHSTPDEPEPLLARFGSGCSQMIGQFDDLNIPQAMIGSTDVAMRRYVPPDLIFFTVTRPMFERLCSLDEKSFLYKQFWQETRKARGLPPT